MIPEARAVRLSRKERDVLEARCRSPVTIQRDLKRARIVLLAAAGRSTRSIAKEVGVQPRIVSHWRRRFADDGLEGLQDKPRPGKEPIYTMETDRAGADRPEPRLQEAWDDDLVRGSRCRDRQGSGRAQKAAPARRIPWLHGQGRCRLSRPRASRRVG